MNRWWIGALVVLTLLLGTVGPANGSWPSKAEGGVNECNGTESGHCYSIAEHSVKGLDSIVYIKDLNVNVSEASKGARSTHEQWISFGNEKEWVETGDVTGYPFDCCNPHPFYAEKKAGVYKEELSPGIVPAGVYNHYELYDSEHNGSWHVIWNGTDVGHYGGGWPEKYTEQIAGVEAVSTSEPGSLERQEVAWSNGGEWFPWTGATWSAELGLCIKANPESGAAGNIQAGTKRGAHETGWSC